MKNLLLVLTFAAGAWLGYGKAHLKDCTTATKAKPIEVLLVHSINSSKY